MRKFNFFSKRSEAYKKITGILKCNQFVIRGLKQNAHAALKQASNKEKHQSKSTNSAELLQTEDLIKMIEIDRLFFSKIPSI